MKKNLSFLMMLMAFVGILSAQIGPKFNYQAVVRHHVTVDGQEMDTLYHDQTVDITITITQPGESEPVTVYQEFHNGTPTTENGFVSIVIGEGADQSGTLSTVDWENATVVAAFVINGEEPVTLSMPVKPVPFALQAGAAPLTTEAIADYLQNVPQDEALQVLNALVADNHDLQEAIEDAIEEYLKTTYGYQIAVQLAAYYMQKNLTPAEAKDYYDALKANTNVTAKIKELVKEFVMNEGNRTLVKGWVKPVVLYCLDNTTLQDVKDIYHALQTIPATEKQQIKQVVKAYMETYVQSEDFKSLITNNMSNIAADVNDIVASISKDEALAAWGWLGLTNNEVKTVLRNKLNEYIDSYAGAWNLTGVDIPTGNLIEIPDCTIDYCQLEDLYNAWAETPGN